MIQALLYENRIVTRSAKVFSGEQLFLAQILPRKLDISALLVASEYFTMLIKKLGFKDFITIPIV